MPNDRDDRFELKIGKARAERDGNHVSRQVQLLRETGNLKLVQKALNHSDIKTTTRYAHVLTEEVAAALDKISRKKSRSKGRKVS
jgi:integrase